MNNICLLAVLLLALQQSLVLSQSDCTASDSALKHKRAYVCDSLVQSDTEWCGDIWALEPNAKKDWPTQVVYLQDVLDLMENTDVECTTTEYYKDTVKWLNYDVMAPEIDGNFGWTWDIFQVQYYDTPRLPGTRIESPDTLGRKCWAFAYLEQMWDPIKLAKIPYDMHNFTTIYTASVPLTMNLCDKVQANCFVNATYDASRNGSCPGDQDKFHYLGFDRENIKRKNILKYPFW